MANLVGRGTNFRLCQIKPTLRGPNFQNFATNNFSFKTNHFFPQTNLFLSFYNSYNAAPKKAKEIKKKKNVVLIKKKKVEKVLKERERDGGFVITRGKKAKMIFTRSLPVNGIEKGEIKEVSKGYARNYLIPYRFAVYATEENRELYKEFTDSINYAEREKKLEIGKWRKRLQNIVVNFKRHTPNIEAPPIAPVDKKNISEKLYLQHGIEVLPENIHTEPIWKLGTFSIDITLDGKPELLQIEIKKR